MVLDIKRYRNDIRSSVFKAILQPQNINVVIIVEGTTDVDFYTSKISEIDNWKFERCSDIYSKKNNKSGVIQIKEFIDIYFKKNNSMDFFYIIDKDFDNKKYDINSNVKVTEHYCVENYAYTSEYNIDIFNEQNLKKGMTIEKMNHILSGMKETKEIYQDNWDFYMDKSRIKKGDFLSWKSLMSQFPGKILYKFFDIGINIKLIRSYQMRVKFKEINVLNEIRDSLNRKLD